jgi:phosphatidate cytidylyltransferase
MQNEPDASVISNRNQKASDSNQPLTTMLKYRLVYGTLMTVFFAAIVIFDGWMDGTLTASVADDKPVQGTILCILITLLVIPAQLELSKLAVAKNLKIFSPISIIASILFATSWYWPQLVEISPAIYLFFLSAFSLLGLLLYQYIRYGTSAVLANCGANYFSIIYLGLLGAFVLAVRIDFGPWELLMFVFVVKSADIGAYSFGSLFGKHKFSPKISPSKSWEGMAGAVAIATIVAILFAASCDIMVWWSAAIFGICFAFIGQIGDLAESMIKRDAEQKDSASKVPGFGGILDIVDSPLLAAPFAYLFFMFSSR